MDQESWTFLFKRWSDDYASSQRLQVELASLKQKYDSLLGQFQVLQHEREELHARSISDRHPRSENGQSGMDARRPEYQSMREMVRAVNTQPDSSAAEIQYLKNENNNLHLALRQHEEQAASSSQSIPKLSKEVQKLTLENARLGEQRDSLSQNCQEMAHRFQNLQLEVKMAHDTNQKLEEQATEAVRQVEVLRAELARVALTADKFEDVASQQRTVALYEKQIQELTQSLVTKDTEKKELTNDLTNCRDSLQKLRDANRSLTSTVANLQGMVNQFKAHTQALVTNLSAQILHKLNGAHTASTDAGQAQQSPTHKQRFQPGSNTATDKPQSKETESKCVDQKQIGTDQCQTPHNLRTVNDKAAAQVTSQPAPNTTSTTIPPADASPIPLDRRQALTGMPITARNIPDTREKLFDRHFLRSTIGGTMQALIVRVSDSQTPLAKAREITSYLCPGLDHNPWCPIAPGQHGYMFVGLGREKDTFLEPQDFNVFVGLLKDKSRERRRYQYIGVYRAVRVPPLTVDEWNTLSDPVKGTYVLRTKEKTSDSRGLAQIRAAYDAGELMVPCVKLECVDFDEVLFASLVETKAKAPPTPVSEKLPSSAKRRRVTSTGDSAQSSHRKKLTLIV